MPPARISGLTLRSTSDGFDSSMTFLEKIVLIFKFIVLVGFPEINIVIKSCFNT